MAEPTALSVEIAKLQLEPGDTLVLKLDFKIKDFAQYELISAMLKRALPQGVKTMVLEEGMQLQVIKAPA